MGRPKKVIDYELVSKLASIHCTQEEVASVIGFNRKVFERDKKIKEVYDDGILKGKSSLRRKQMELALAGNVSMLVWLGKQILGQTDKVHQTQNTQIDKLDLLIKGIDKKANEPNE